MGATLQSKGRISALPLSGDSSTGVRQEVVTTSEVSKAWVAGAVFLAAAGALFRSPLLFGLGVLLGSALLVAWLWFRYCLQNFTVERRFSQNRAFWGEEIDMAQVLTNDKVLPVPWLTIEDEFPASLEIDSPAVGASSKSRRKALNTAVSLGWYEQVLRHYTVKCVQRGEHDFGPIEAQSGDVFGLFRRTATITTPQPLLVYPRYVSVERLGITARQPFGDFKAVQQLATDPLRFRSVREYARGDNPRYIHWRASARKGALQTKQFEPAATPKLYIFCNQDTSARFWEGLDRHTLELTITVAASLANHALEEGYMVGLQINSFARQSDRQTKLAPSRAPGQFPLILEALARAQGWSGMPVQDMIRAERRALPLGATLVVVTGIVTDELLDVLLALRRAGHPVTLVQVSGSEQAALAATHISGEALRAQGIIYYRVDGVGVGQSLQQVSLAGG